MTAIYQEKDIEPEGEVSGKDAEENRAYIVEGSFMQIQKTFSIMDLPDRKLQ